MAIENSVIEAKQAFLKANETKESGVKPVSYHCIVAVSTVLKLINDHIIHIDWASAGLE